MSAIVDQVSDARPRIALNRDLVDRLLTRLDLHSVRDRAEYLNISYSVVSRMFREPTPDQPDEHALRADTIAALLAAFPNQEFSDLFHVVGGTR